MGLSLWTHPYLAFKSILYGWDANSTSTVAEQLSLMEGIILTVSLLNTQTVNSEDWFKFRKEGKNEKEKLHYLTKRPRFIILQITPSETENKPPQIRLKKKIQKNLFVSFHCYPSPFAAGTVHPATAVKKYTCTSGIFAVLFAEWANKR